MGMCMDLRMGLCLDLRMGLRLGWTQGRIRPTRLKI